MIEDKEVWYMHVWNLPLGGGILWLQTEKESIGDPYFTIATFEGGSWTDFTDSEMMNLSDFLYDNVIVPALEEH